MRKIITTAICIGLTLVVLGYFFAQKSSQLINENKQEIESIKNTANKIESSVSELQNNINYKYLELNKSDYKEVNTCLQSFLNNQNISQNCNEEILRVITNDFSEQGPILKICMLNIGI